MDAGGGDRAGWPTQHTNHTKRERAAAGPGAKLEVERPKRSAIATGLGVDAEARCGFFWTAVKILLGFFLCAVAVVVAIPFVAGAIGLAFGLIGAALGLAAAAIGTVVALGAALLAIAVALLPIAVPVLAIIGLIALLRKAV